MEYPLLPVLTILSLAVMATHAALPPELYWKSVLPTTPMPKAITDVLYPDWVVDKSTNVGVRKGGVSVHAGKGSDTNVNIGGKGGGVSIRTGHKGKPETVTVGSYAPFRYNYAATESQLHNDPNAVGSYAPFRYNYAATESQLQNDPNAVRSYAPFGYTYAATESQLHNNPNVALFFLEKDLHPGTKLDLHFIRSSNSATFLPRQVADTIPFSSEKLEDVFNELSVRPGSEEAQIMKNTIEECEETGIKGEEKYCATSLESMVDFSTSKLGKNVEVVSTMVDKEAEMQKYTMTSGIKKLAAGDKAVVCHKQKYPYAVFYCHKTETTRAYFVPLEGANGIRVKAVAVCHIDTSEWNPKHLAFQVLKIKPGTLPVCHFLPEDHVVWVPK